MKEFKSTYDVTGQSRVESYGFVKDKLVIITGVELAWARHSVDVC